MGFLLNPYLPRGAWGLPQQRHGSVSELPSATTAFCCQLLGAVQYATTAAAPTRLLEVKWLKVQVVTRSTN